MIRRIRGWLKDNEDAIPDLKTGKKWLVGYGWDQNSLPDKKYPTAVPFPENYVDSRMILISLNSLAFMLNSIAMTVIVSGFQVYSTSLPLYVN